MQKSIRFLATLLLLTLTVNAQQLQENTINQISVHYTLPRLDIHEEGGFILFNLEGYHQGGTVGCPSLPVCNSMLAVPFCDGMEVSVSNARYDTIHLSDKQLRPLQPSRFKSDTGAAKWHYDEKIYSDDSFFQLPLASVEHIGIARDRNLASLCFSPISYNPVSRTAIVCRSADVAIRFRNADAARTSEYYNLYHTPAFSVGQTLNELAIPKSVTTATPLRMVIMAGSSLQCSAIRQFAEWKRSQGMLVDVIYVESGIAATNIASQLKSMYTNASATAPAPTYVLLIGDRAQMPAHDSRLSSSWYSSYDHITDLYYATWTSSDYLPDCYIGRFSATDVSTLTNIIDKTLYYEKYLFANDDYLNRVALVAGVDESYDYGYKYADPTMDYVATFYINATNGYDSICYFKNNTASAPIAVAGSSNASTAATHLKNFYNLGAGWINYSAHGDWNCWYKPSFYVSDANAMTNTNMPSVMIGNCCLTNKFDKATCLGEALLRRGDNAGAVAYIGGTNSTIWNEDFYWAVGIRSNISNTMTLQYIASKKGVYDRLFHTHGEALEDYVVTTGEIIMQGNMSVQNSSSSTKQYYWEIYELMGDPSLMPWLGKAATLQPTARFHDITSFTVQAVPGAYVALVSNTYDTVLAAAFAGTSGSVTLQLPAGTQITDYSLSITAQGYKPFLQQCSSAFVGIDEVATTGITVSPNPATDRCTVTAEGLQHVTLLNLAGQTLMAGNATDGHCSLSLGALPAGLYLLRAETTSGPSVQKLIIR